MPINKKATTDAVEILHRKLHARHPEKLQALAECRANDEIARTIQTLRMHLALPRLNWPRSLAPPHPSFADWRMPTTRGTPSRCFVESRPR